MAASVAHALRRLPPAHRLHGEGRGRGGRWLLWIVGAREAMEGELVRRGCLAEALVDLCPSLAAAGVEVLLVGPEMGRWEAEAARPGGTSLLVRAVCYAMLGC
jgi:hypothetical protein